MLKHNLSIPKNDGHAPEYAPSPLEIDEALLCRKALRNLFRHGDPNRLEPTFRSARRRR